VGRPPAPGISLRWLDPSGAEVARVDKPKHRGRRLLTAELQLPGGLAKPGIGQVEVLLDGDRADRTTFHVVP
jgi:hypothetical protein